MTYGPREPSSAVLCKSFFANFDKNLNHTSLSAHAHCLVQMFSDVCVVKETGDVFHVTSAGGKNIGIDERNHLSDFRESPLARRLRLLKVKLETFGRHVLRVGRSTGHQDESCLEETTDQALVEEDPRCHTSVDED